MFFALARYRWLTDPYPHWAQPAGAIGSLDIRPIGQQATAGGIGGVGLFGFETDPSGRPGVIVLGDDPAGIMGPVRKAALEDALGLTARLLTLDASRLGLAIFEGLTTKAVPDGSNGPRPLMPSSRQRLRVHFGPAGRDIPFSIDDPEYRANVLAVYREDYRKIRAEALAAGTEHHRKWLGHLVLRKHRGADWRQFIPDDLPPEEPLEPETSYTESFNTADSDTLGPDLSWTETAGDIDVVSNAAAPGSTAGHHNARADSNLTSSDMYAQVTATMTGETGTPDIGVFARYSSSADTGYLYLITTYQSVDHDCKLYKVVAGAYTELVDDNDAHAAPNGTTMRLDVDSDLLTGTFGGASHVTVTDMAITTGVRGGIRFFSNATNSATAHKIDDFITADLATAGMSVRLAGYGGLAGPGGLAGRIGLAG